MRTEFHGEQSTEPDDPDRFVPRSVREKQQVAALHIDVIRYRGICQITGVAGRLTLDKKGLTELIDDLTEALDFIEAHPPRKREQD